VRQVPPAETYCLNISHLQVGQAFLPDRSFGSARNG
jgi:hypothetical protein